MYNKLTGHLGVNEPLYRELYQRAQRLSESATESFLWDGSKILRIEGFTVYVNSEDTSLFIDYTYESQRVRKVLHVDARGIVTKRGMADARLLRRAVAVFRRAMILDDLANV